MFQYNAEIKLIGVITTHKCNKNCKNCVDKLLNSSADILSIDNYKRFLNAFVNKYNYRPTILLLGGEPTLIPEEILIEYSDIASELGFRIIMSTNGILRDKIISLIPYYDSIQVTTTIYNIDENVEFYKKYRRNINLKLAGDETLTYDKLVYFIEKSKGYTRRSVCMYFTEDFIELVNDTKIWDLLNQLEWKDSGQYSFTWYEGVRFKKCIPGKANVLLERSVPNLYPNGNYNCGWINEEMNDYLNLFN